MRKLLLILITAVFFCMILPRVGSAADTGTAPIYIGNKKFPVDGKIVNGVIYLPAVSLANTLGVRLRIGWSTKYHTVTLNGIAMTSHMYYTKDSLLFPASATESLLNIKASWDSSKKAIMIRKGPRSNTAISSANSTPASTSSPASNTQKPSGETYTTPSENKKNSKIFIPQTEKNDVFSITVSDVAFGKDVKDYYKPNPNNQFVFVYISQTNISAELQVYTGKFSLVDDKSKSYEPIEGLSNFWIQVLKPYGTNFGYLVFEIPENSEPISLTLHSIEGRQSINVYLKKGWTE